MEVQLKRLMFRAQHMGSTENDFLFGRFALRHLHALTPAQLGRFEALIAENDSDLYNWVTGRLPVPPHIDHDVMRMLIDFARKEAANP